MDEDHLVAAARYVALNPVRARLVDRAVDWRWSSVRAHLKGRDDGLVTVAPLTERSGGRFADWIETPAAPEVLSALRGRNDRPTAGRSGLPQQAGARDRPRSPTEAAGAEAEGNGGLSKASPEFRNSWNSVRLKHDDEKVRQ